MTANTINFWIQLIVAVGFLLGMIWGVIRFGHNILARSVSERLEEIRKETKPNLILALGPALSALSPGSPSPSRSE